MAGQEHFEHGYGVQAVIDAEDASDNTGELESGVDYSKTDGVRPLPWMAIAIALHAILLVIFVFVVTVQPREEIFPPPEIDLAQDSMIPIPEDEPPPVVVVDKPELIVADPSVTPRVEDTTDTEFSDDEDKPNPSPTPSPSETDSPDDNPSPVTGPSSPFGPGASGDKGGKGPKGGEGGPFKSRPPGGCGPVHPDNVKAGLQWLADHQNDNGSWSSTNFMDVSKRLKKGAATTGIIEFERVGEAGTGYANSVDVGLTGLALLAFVGDGYTLRKGEFRETVRRAFDYLVSVQDAEGCFGIRDSEEFMYNHAISAMAVIELYAMTSERTIKPHAQRAVDFIVNAQNPGMGWRYDVRPGINDSSVTAWMVLALKSARMAELDFPEAEVF
ncbi:MAG: hypothetical protein L6Q71_03930, partial [Planctomycetes bacterium]|nr:hypothetical protein [Planctomycetota bacterium]